MSTGQLGHSTTAQILLHPSVGTWVDPAKLTRRQRVAAISKVRCLEHQLFEGDRVCRSLTRHAAESLVAQINELRDALGWLEIDLDRAQRASLDRREIAAAK